MSDFQYVTRDVLEQWFTDQNKDMQALYKELRELDKNCKDLDFALAESNATCDAQRAKILELEEALDAALTNNRRADEQYKFRLFMHYLRDNYSELETIEIMDHHIQSGEYPEDFLAEYYA